MGQCLSIAKPIVQEVVTDLVNDAAASANKPNEPSHQAYDVNAAADTPPSYASAAATEGPPSSAEQPSSSTFKSGAIHSSLPNDAEQHTVRNVYDGDTLTLTDERRVRLLGIDTPEIKENQPYAEEAKAYTKDRCNKQDIWISFEPNGEKEDHYGRLLCFVWVSAGSDGYLCINEGIVEAGLANAYHPGKGKHLHNWDKLIELQSQAREAKRGVWKNFEDFTVVKTANGSAYHKRSCEHLASVHNLTEMMASEAAEKGLHPCRTCLS